MQTLEIRIYFEFIVFLLYYQKVRCKQYVEDIVHSAAGVHGPSSAMAFGLKVLRLKLF
jgi:hypothetical protein